MGVCAFVASGSNFDVDDYLPRTAFDVVCVFHDGEIPTSEIAQHEPRLGSGFVAMISRDEFPHLLDQVAEAISFLETHNHELRWLKGLGADMMVLDLRIPEEKPPKHTHFLPMELITAMSRLQMGLHLSIVETPKRRQTPRRRINFNPE